MNLKEDHLWIIPVKFRKIPVYSFWGSFLKEEFTDTCTCGRTNGQTDGRMDEHTHDGHNAMTLSQTSPCFYVSAAQIFWKHCRNRRNCSMTVLAFSHHCLNNFLSKATTKYFSHMHRRWDPKNCLKESLTQLDIEPAASRSQIELPAQSSNLPRPQTYR